jgi:sugar lactone lactonase YvrE
MTDVASVTTMVVINPIGDNLEVGTRAHWDSDTQNLYYVDVPQSTIYRYRPATGIVTKARVGERGPLF